MGMKHSPFKLIEWNKVWILGEPYTEIQEVREKKKEREEGTKYKVSIYI